MDYRIDIAVHPDMADQIPILRDSFNVEGFRMTQKDIELISHYRAHLQLPENWPDFHGSDPVSGAAK